MGDNRRRRRVFLLGIDGLAPAVLRRFAADGRLPRLARHLAQSAVTELVPTFPPLTCPCWLSIASGADPGTLGVPSILMPAPGEAPDRIRNGFDRRLSRAEYLWETMARDGRRAIVLKYPGSWPPRDGDFIQVDGAGGYADITCTHEASASTAYIAGKPIAGHDEPAHCPAGYRDIWRTHAGEAAGIVRLAAHEPSGWRSLDDRFEPRFECAIPLVEHHRRGRHVLYALAGTLAGRPTVVLSADKNAGSAVACVTTDAPWSGWIDHGSHATRFKLVGLDVDARVLHLYRTSGHRLDGFTRPASLAQQLTSALGPPVEWTGAFDFLSGLVDLDTQLELYRDHTEWLAGAIRTLTTAYADWDGFFTQWHVVEYAHHLVGASLSADHPLHDPSTAVRDVEWLARVYQLADELVGVVERVVDDDTLLLVCGDHGHDLVHTLFFVNHFLRRQGWLTTIEHGDGVTIDWSRTAAYGLYPGWILLNTKARWPGGIVEEADAPKLANDIGRSLRELVDPRTHVRPITEVLDRGALAACGQHGPLTPDLAFVLDRGYETATRLIGATDAEFQITEPHAELTSGHGSFAPGSSSARTLALWSGSGVTAGVGAEPLRAIDIAPTLAAYLGIAAPAHADGRSRLASLGVGSPA